MNNLNLNYVALLLEGHERWRITNIKKIHIPLCMRLTDYDRKNIETLIVNFLIFQEWCFANCHGRCSWGLQEGRAVSFIYPRRWVWNPQRSRRIPVQIRQEWHSVQRIFPMEGHGREYQHFLLVSDMFHDSWSGGEQSLVGLSRSGPLVARPRCLHWSVSMAG